MHHARKTIGLLGGFFASTLLVHCVSSQDGGPAAGTPFVPGVPDAAPAPQGDAGTTLDATVPVDAAPPDDAAVADAAANDGAPSGRLDPTFGGTGYVTASNVGSLDGGPPLFEYVYGGALDTSGRLLLGGVSQYQGAGGYAALVRVTSAGAVDTTFGTAGAWAKTSTIAGTYDTAYAVTAGPSDSVLAVGQSDNNNINEVVWKVGSGGALDTTFAGTGYTGQTGIAFAVTRDTTGNVFVGGQIQSNGGPLAVWKYTSAGALDTTFGAPNGWITATRTSGYDGGQPWDTVEGLQIDGSGRVLAVGQSSTDAADDFAGVIWRFTSTGAVDTTFNTTGHLLFEHTAAGVVTLGDAVRAVVLDAQGNIVVVGSSYTNGATPTSRAWVARVTPAGALDATFGTAGVVTFAPIGAGGVPVLTSGFAIAIDTKGRILVAGSTGINISNPTLAVWRLDTHGALDATFGTAGAFTMTGTSGGTYDAPTGVAVDAVDRAVVFGNSTNDAGAYAWTAWRLTP